jgi:hypothetical protein
MDEGRIRELTAEVLAQVRGGGGGGDLESRVAALETAVARIQGQPGATALPAPGTHVHAHPALRVLSVPGGGDRCILEPDRPCTQSGACRVFGH